MPDELRGSPLPITDEDEDDDDEKDEDKGENDNKDPLLLTPLNGWGRRSLDGDGSDTIEPEAEAVVDEKDDEEEKDDKGGKNKAGDEPSRPVVVPG